MSDRSKYTIFAHIATSEESPWGEALLRVSMDLAEPMTFVEAQKRMTAHLEAQAKVGVVIGYGVDLTDALNPKDEDEQEGDL